MVANEIELKAAGLLVVAQLQVLGTSGRGSHSRRAS